MSWICEACSRVIFGTSSDPLVSAKGLGWKNYHYVCAQAAWGISSLQRKEPSELNESHLAQVAVGEGDLSAMMKETMRAKLRAPRGKFLVQCTFIKDGLPATRLSDFANSLEEAEEYFHRQVQACPEGGGVDCAVLLVLKDGKQTQVDGHSFGATGAISQNHPAYGGTVDEDEESE